MVGRKHEFVDCVADWRIGLGFGVSFGVKGGRYFGAVSKTVWVWDGMTRILRVTGAQACGRDVIVRVLGSGHVTCAARTRGGAEKLRSPITSVSTPSILKVSIVSAQAIVF